MLPQGTGRRIRSEGTLVVAMLGVLVWLLGAMRGVGTWSAFNLLLPASLAVGWLAAKGRDRRSTRRAEGVGRRARDRATRAARDHVDRS